MDKSISILDGDYQLWLKQLVVRFHQAQIKSAVHINQEMIRYYWDLGKDIVNMKAENKYGSHFYASLSRDLKLAIHLVDGLSESTIRYAKRMYELYSPIMENLPQVVEDFVVEENFPQLVEQLHTSLFCVPWGHHRLIIDKCSSNLSKSIFYLNRTVRDGLSRSMLLNIIDSDLYEREGKSISNFNVTLPSETSDLAIEMTKDPYNFAFAGITGKYNERKLKDALLSNITEFLVELGTGFAYVGKEYRLQIGNRENFIDLLFYNLKLSCYVVVEVKIGKFEFADVGQLGGYVVACNHQLRKEGRDNPTIGLLICKEKDRIQAQYALESTSQPIGISEYELEKFYPEKVEGTIPTIKEIEMKLNNSLK